MVSSLNKLSHVLFSQSSIGAAWVLYIFTFCFLIALRADTFDLNRETYECMRIFSRSLEFFRQMLPSHPGTDSRPTVLKLALM